MGRIYAIDVPDMPQDLANQVESFLNGQRRAGNSIATENVGAFSSWFERKNPTLFRKVKPYIEKILKALKEIGEGLKAFGEGVLKTYATVTVAPGVAIYEGVKEGLKNGIDAGIEKGISETKKFLKDLWN